mmetsp:Transcript_12794/g.16258  ORF Transcript_12794/g.16258 Transcript_12794/m.16258 type:complete len:91 (-) Transcript_12794:201-473(-)
MLVYIARKVARKIRARYAFAQIARQHKNITLCQIRPKSKKEEHNLQEVLLNHGDLMIIERMSQNIIYTRFCLVVAKLMWTIHCVRGRGFI